MVGQHRIKRVAPGATIIAAAGTHEHGRAADVRHLALDGRAKDFADADSMVHGRYSAHTRGVSLTRTAATSGQRALHQSYSHLLITSLVVRSWPSTSLRCLWSSVESMNSRNAESS